MINYVRIYEISPDGTREQAFADLVADITAANQLGISFEVRTVRSKEFRHGGNVSKAKILSYVLTLDEEENLEG